MHESQTWTFVPQYAFYNSTGLNRYADQVLKKLVKIGIDWTVSAFFCICIRIRICIWQSKICVVPSIRPPVILVALHFPPTQVSINWPDQSPISSVWELKLKTGDPRKSIWKTSVCFQIDWCSRKEVIDCMIFFSVSVTRHQTGWVCPEQTLGTLNLNCKQWLDQIYVSASPDCSWAKVDIHI